MARKKQDDLSNNLNIDKKKIVDDIVNEVCSDINDKIDSIIDEKVRYKLENMEKRFIKYKNKSIFKRNIIILLLIGLIGFETKILYDNDYFSNKKSSYNDNSLKTVNNDEGYDLDWYKDKYGYLMDMIVTNDTYLYEKDYKTSSLNISTKLNMAYNNIKSNITSNNGVINVSNNNIKKSYISIFGSDEEYKEVNFNSGCLNFIYNKKMDEFMAIDVECDSSEIINNISDIYLEDDNVIIISLVNVDGKSIGSYKYTFKKNGSSYYFYSINKVK